VLLAAASTLVSLAPSALASATPRNAALSAFSAPEPDGVLAADSFDRSVTAGLGASTQGGAWELQGDSKMFSVGGGAGMIRLTAGSGAGARLGSGSSLDVRSQVRVSLDRAQAGGGTYVALVARSTGPQDDYRVRLRFLADKSVNAQLVRRTQGRDVVLSTVRVPHLTYTAGGSVFLAAKVTGSSPTRLSVKAWPSGVPEPASWLSTSSDATAILQRPGAVGLWAYLSGSSTITPETVRLDDLQATLPAVQIVAGPAANSSSRQDSASLAFTSTRTPGAFSCRLDGGGWNRCSSPTLLGNLADGRHAFDVRATDSDGETTPMSSRTWTVDSTAPAVTFTSGPPAQTSDTNASFGFRLDEPGAAQCRLDSSAWTPCTSPVAYSGLAVAQHALSVRATDAAGNVSAAPATRSWTVSAPAPAPAPPVGRPGPGNTGVPAGTRLTPHYGNLVITTPGASYDGLDIHGFVTIKAPNVTITRSIIRGGVATGNIGLVTNYDPNATGFVLSDSELVPEFPSVWIDGIKGGNFTIRRVDVHGTTDNVKVHGNNVTVDSSWLHGTAYRSSDPNQGGGPTHNDAVQILGGRNIRVLGSTLNQANNSAVQITQDYSVTTDVVLDGNWIDGGGCSINLANKPLPTMVGVTVSNDRFGRDQRLSGCAIIAGTATTLTQHGNVWDDTSQPVTISDGG